MATYPFWKLHGLGNDFVFFDAMEEELELSTAEVAALCDRHTGIGGDGVIVVMRRLYALHQRRWIARADVRQRRALLREIPC